MITARRTARPRGILRTASARVRRLEASQTGRASKQRHAGARRVLHFNWRGRRSSVGCLPENYKFAGDSPLEEVGFEPSVFYPESSLSAAFKTLGAAKSHPYSAQICTPASTLQKR